MTLACEILNNVKYALLTDAIHVKFCLMTKFRIYKIFEKVSPGADDRAISEWPESLYKYLPGLIYTRSNNIVTLALLLN